MSRERKAYYRKFKLMSLELSDTRLDFVVLAKELDTPYKYQIVREKFTTGQGITFIGNSKVILTETEQELAS